MRRRGIIAFSKQYLKLVLISMVSPYGVAVNAEQCAMLLESANVQLHLRNRIKKIATRRGLMRVLLHASIVTASNGGASSESVKGGAVNRSTLVWCGARYKSMSSDVMRISLLMMLGMLADNAKALGGSSGRKMVLHAVPFSRKLGKTRTWSMFKLAGTIGMHL